MFNEEGQGQLSSAVLQEDRDGYTQIGNHFVPNAMVSSATDSVTDLKAQNWSTLVERFHRDGYLAFSSFSETSDALDKVLKVVGRNGSESFEVNVSNGMGDEARAEEWKKLGQSAAFQTLQSNSKVQEVLKSLLREEKFLEVPEKIEFQLMWVRGKAKNEGTAIHVDYYHLTNDDVLDETDMRSFNVWTRLSDAPQDSSFLALCPGSHLMRCGQKLS